MHQQGPLQRLKEAQRAKKMALCSSSAQHLASASDADNEAYMQAFEQAFSSLSTRGAQEQLSSGYKSGSLTAEATAAARKHASSSQTIAFRSDKAAGHDHALSTSDSQSGRIAGSRRQSSGISTATAASRGSAASCSSRAGDQCVGACNAGFCSAASPIASGWRTGPTDEAGLLVQLSDRPIMCSAARWSMNEVVVGSSDHALYVVDIQQGKKKRTLYSKACGHTEWVTCVCYLPDGKILSGGMDGRLWLWPAGGSSGTEIRSAHSAPVSKVASLAPPTEAAAGANSSSNKGSAADGRQLAVSCSYDKTVKVWDVSGGVRGRDVAVLSGHTGPVLEMDVLPGGASLVTGDRKGDLMCWDLGSGSSSWGVPAAHQGHVTALTWQQSAPGQQQQLQQAPGAGSGCCVVSGGQDGCVRVWDGRSGDCVAEQAVHVDKKGRGAVGTIVTGCGSRGDLVVTCGADMTLRVLDSLMSYQPVHTMKLTDFPYALAAIGNLAITGCGDGSVHILDVDLGSTLYALGAGKAAVRAVEVSAKMLVCTGDDGYVISYRFA